jgi:hypothetical protein
MLQESSNRPGVLEWHSLHLLSKGARAQQGSSWSMTSDRQKSESFAGAMDVGPVCIGWDHGTPVINTAEGAMMEPSFDPEVHSTEVPRWKNLPVEGGVEIQPTTGGRLLP